NVKDGAAAGNDVYYNVGGLITRGATFQLYYSDAETVNLTGETGNNTYNVQSTLAGTLLALTDLTGTDTFNVGDGECGDPTGCIGIHASGDPIYVDDSALFDTATYTLDNNTLTRPGFGGMGWTNASSISLAGESGDNTYNIHTAAIPLNITDGG